RLTETANIFVLCACFLCLFNHRTLAGIVLLVISILIRPALDLLAPVLVAAVAIIVHRHGMASAIRRVGGNALVFVVLMSPLRVHNYAKYGEFVRLNLGDGLVLYSRNNPLNRRGGGVSTGTEGTDLDRTPFNHITDPVELNRA